MIIGSLVLGESYPFTMVPMFASLGRQTETAVVVFLVDGQPANVRGYGGFQGVDMTGVGTTAPLSLAYQRDDLKAWIEAHPAREGAEPCRFQVAVALDTFVVHEGALRRTRTIAAEGTACGR